MMHIIHKMQHILLQKKNQNIYLEKIRVEQMIGKMDQTLARIQQSPPKVLFRTDYLE